MIHKTNVIDCHLHLPIIEDNSNFKKRVSILLNEMRKNGIDYGFVIADSLIDTTIGNNQKVYNAIKDEKSLYMIYGYTPLERRKEQIEELKILLKTNKLIGIKLYSNHEEYSLDDIRLKEIYKFAEDNKLFIMIHTEWSDDAFPQYSHPYYVKQIVEEYKDLKIICSHLWSGKEDIALYWLKDLANVYFDFSSFIMSEKIKNLYPNCEFRNIEEASKILRKVHEKIPSKLLFGSDYGECEIKDHVKLSLLTFNENELKDIYYNNILNVCDLK